MKKLLVVAFVVLHAALAQAQPAPTRPDLIVVISIDQFRYEYLTRFRPYFSADGFRRFLDRGADHFNGYYPYATTYTGPGHAAIGTGYTPSENGIAGNDWYDRTKGRVVYCAEDTRATPPFSPAPLASDSLGDRIQEKFAGSRVYAVAIKDRASILMAGRKATAAYWYDWRSGFTSSTYYRGANNALVAAYNASLPALLAEHPVWTQSSFIPAEDLSKVTYDPEELRKFKTARLGTSFPHPIASLDALTYTPYGNDIVIGFAKRLIESEKIGATPNAPDLLFISLSSPDYLGHYFGPDSLEVADSVVRTDRQIAELFQWLDQRFSDRYTVALSADHGVQSIPEVAQALGRDAGRVRFRNAAASTKTIGEFAKLAPARVELERLAAAALDLQFPDDAPSSNALVMTFEEPALYVNWSRVAELKLDGERVKRVLRDSALKIKGVAAAWTNSELMAANPSAPELEKMMRRSFRADRTGDVPIILKPGYVFDWSGTGATHGQAVEDDQHVPVMFWGRGVRPGRYAVRAAPTDIARSLGSLVGVDAGGPETRVLPGLPASDAQAVIRLALTKAPTFTRLIRGERLPADFLPGVELATPAPTSTESLPAGHARLDLVEVNGDAATVRIWYGPVPVPVPQPGVMSMACGTGYTYQLKRAANGEWELLPTVGVTQC
jgi:hypothetical protein